MKRLSNTDNPNDLAGCYGNDWRQGVCVDHERLFIGRTGHLPSGKRILVAVDGTFEPVLCGEIVWIYTEDGRLDGRCGEAVYGDDGACPDHQAQIDRWRGETEADLMEWERRMEDQAAWE